MRRLAYALFAAALLTFGQTVGTLAQTADDTTERANRKCDTLKRRIAKEETSLAAFEQTIAEDKKGRESCSTKSVCGSMQAVVTARTAFVHRSIQRQSTATSTRPTVAAPSATA